MKMILIFVKMKIKVTLLKIKIYYPISLKVKKRQKKKLIFSVQANSLKKNTTNNSSLLESTLENL